MSNIIEVTIRKITINIKRSKITQFIKIKEELQYKTKQATTNQTKLIKRSKKTGKENNISNYGDFFHLPKSQTQKY